MRWLLQVLVPQLARPHGMLGQLVASLLNRGNRTINLHVLGALEVAPRERVLELGFGGGVGLAILLAHEPSVRASGIDPSREMLQRCQRRFGDRVALIEGTVDALPFADAAFDKVFGVVPKSVELQVAVDFRYAAFRAASRLGLSDAAWA